MSHNITKVNTQVPSADGTIQLSLDDIITVNSPANGQLLQKSDSDWQTKSLSSTTEKLLNNSDVNSPGNTVYKYDIGDNYISRKVSGEYNILNKITLVNSSGPHVPVSTGSWSMAYYLLGSNFPSGSKILFRAVVGAFRNSGSNLTVQWYTGNPNTNIVYHTPIGPKAYSTENYGATAFGLYKSTGFTQYVSLRVVDVTTNGVAISSGNIASIQQITAKQLE